MATTLTKPDETAALALIGTGPVAVVADLQDRMNRLAAIANVLTPGVQAQIPAKQAVALSAVQIDTRVNDQGQGPECYFDKRFCERGEIVLGKVGILKIMAAAGLEIVNSDRLDDANDPHYCNWQVRIAGRDMTGLWRTVVKSKELDLRDGAPETMQPEYKGSTKTGNMVKKQPTALADQRRHIQSLAETKALLKAVRDFLGLRQKYTVAEASRLWIVPRLVPNLDPRDPGDADALRDEALGRRRQLYGGSTADEKPVPTPAPPVTRATHEPIEIVPNGGDGTGERPPTAAATERAAGSTPAPSTTSNGTDDLEIPAGLAGPELIVCLCPCGGGCQKEITAAVAEKTTQQLGTPRCADCFPGKTMKLDQHQDLTDFKIPNFPKLTIEQIRKSVQASKK